MIKRRLCCRCRREPWCWIIHARSIFFLVPSLLFSTSFLPSRFVSLPFVRLLLPWYNSKCWVQIFDQCARRIVTFSLPFLLWLHDPIDGCQDRVLAVWRFPSAIYRRYQTKTTTPHRLSLNHAARWYPLLVRYPPTLSLLKREGVNKRGGKATITAQQTQTWQKNTHTQHVHARRSERDRWRWVRENKGKDALIVPSERDYLAAKAN